MSIVTIKNLFLEQKYEQILENNISLLENSNLRDLDTDLIQLLASSLVISFVRYKLICVT